MIRRMLPTLMLLAALPAFADEPKPPTLTPEEQKLAADAATLSREAASAYQAGRYTHAVATFRQVLDIRRKLYPAAKYPDGHSQLAQTLNDLGFVLQAQGQPEEALPHYRQAFEMYQKLYPTSKHPNGHPFLATSINNMGSVLEAMGRPDQALTYFRQALQMRQKLFPETDHPDGHPHLASSLNNVAFALEAKGQAEQALPYYRQALQMKQKLFPESKYPDGHPDLAISLDNLGNVLGSMGQAEQALPYYRQSHQMRRKFFSESEYPDGHPVLAQSLNNLAAVLKAIGQSEQALSYNRQALQMLEKLFPPSKYPNGHPFIARSLSNVGFLLEKMSQAEEALPYYRQALEMTEKLFPASKYADGHPDLVRGLNNMGWVLQSLGRAEPALTYYRKAIRMEQQLFPASKYPDGRTELAGSLNNVGGVLNAMGKPKEALPYYRDSLAMQQRLLRRELATASEEAAFDKVEAEPPYQDAYLSITRIVNHPAADAYAQLWPSRATVTRLLEQRQANARASGTAAGAGVEELRGLRRRIDRLLQDTKMNPTDRDPLLVSAANERDHLERELVDKIPALKHWQELDKLGPNDLVQALPSGAVFVDVLRYTRFEFVDKKQKRTPSYVAFVVAKQTPSPPSPLPRSGGEGSIVRVELEDADSLDAAVRAWRAAIEERRGNAAATTIRERVWARLAPHIPRGTTTLYLATDGDLARLPWAALPIGQDRVLLEDYAIAQVPHGTFLLDQLKFGKKHEGGQALLTLGGVDYGMGIWPALPGTAVETEAIAAIAPGQRHTLGGTDATIDKLKSHLPAARYVHLATHGEFKAAALTAERKRAEKALESRLQGGDSRKIAAKNPLGYVGLVLANGDVLSGLGIVDLPLSKTHLVTLSACETGLGELTGGEGVQGLQRAFHLAGCPNVVASLWNVNDAATAALMVKFYHELWVNKKPPIEALREAQLTIYRRPDLIPILAAERGLKLEKAMQSGSTLAAPADKGTASTKLWAAFVLSGVGR